MSFGIPLVQNRNTQCFETNWQVTNTALQIAPANPYRVAIVIGAPAAGTLYISIAGSASTTAGMRQFSVSSPLILTMKDLGTLVTQQFTAFATSTTQNIAVWEILSSDTTNLGGQP